MSPSAYVLAFVNMLHFLYGLIITLNSLHRVVVATDSVYLDYSCCKICIMIRAFQILPQFLPILLSGNSPHFAPNSTYFALILPYFAPYFTDKNDIDTIVMNYTVE